MQTSQLQSLLCRNAAVITLLTAQMSFIKSTLGSVVNPDHSAWRGQRQQVRKLRTQVIKLAAIQKAIKFDLHAAKLARLRQNGHRRNKHGKDDRRYMVWVSKQAGLELL